MGGNCTDVVKDCDPTKIKYIAMHDYRGDTDKLRRRVEGAVKRYDGRKVWLTEFGILRWGDDKPTRSEMDAYLPKVLTYLESSPDVFRYNWWSSRSQANMMEDGCSLLPEDGVSMAPTSTGKIYADF